MKYENNIDNNSHPPLFMSSIWAKGIIKNNINVKLKKKLKDYEKEQENEKKHEDEKN